MKLTSKTNTKLLSWVIHLPRLIKSITKPAGSSRSIKTAKGMLENAVWSYQDPLPEVTGIHGFLAFYADKVDEIRVGEG